MLTLQCEEKPDDLDGECKMCASVSKESKKTIHHIACFRAKLSDLTLFRKGGLRLTKRWEGTELRDISDRINPLETPTIQFTHSDNGPVFTVRVVRFRVQEGDITARYWTKIENGREVRKEKELAHYCLANVHTTGNDFRQWIHDIVGRVTRTLTIPQEMLLGGPPDRRSVVDETYMMGINHYRRLSDVGFRIIPPWWQLMTGTRGVGLASIASAKLA